MCGLTAGWRVLVLLAFSAAFSRGAVEEFSLLSMTWSSDPSLTVCADLVLNAESDLVRLAITTNGAQSDFEGEIGGGEDPTRCATFTNTPTPTPPITETTTYELSLFLEGNEVQEGAVAFAFPLTSGSSFTCGSSSFGRFVVSDPSILSSTANCLPGVTGLCYVTIDALDPICVAGLDSNHEDFEVCVPSAKTIETNPGDLITTVSLTYTDYLNGGSFSITPSTDESSNSLSELLSNTTDNPVTQRVSKCDPDTNACTFDAGSPSEHIYQLCGVYVDSSSNMIGSVDTFEFQDLNLRVDSVGTTVDFRFANLGLPMIYNVYGSQESVPDITGPPSFTLDCTSISPETFCNGFFYDEQPTYIGVSFVDGSGSKTNAVITSTAAMTTTTTTTTTTTATIGPNVA